jgi:predicted ATPase
LESYAHFRETDDQELQVYKGTDACVGSPEPFIGGNGAGKSNLIEAFRFLREIVNQNLAGYTALKGGADKLLYFGRKRSPEMEMFLEFVEGDISNAYDVKFREQMKIAS